MCGCVSEWEANPHHQQQQCGVGDETAEGGFDDVGKGGETGERRDRRGMKVDDLGRGVWYSGWGWSHGQTSNGQTPYDYEQEQAPL